MKKILSKITLLIASLVISPCICMAWTDENIKKQAVQNVIEVM